MQIARSPVTFRPRPGLHSVLISIAPFTRAVHVAVGAAMVLMSWPWGPALPLWPAEAAFTLAAFWFFARAVYRQRWPDLHHAAMSAALTWSIAAMPGPRAAVAVAAYFLIAAVPWGYTAARAGRREIEAAGHAAMSLGMAAMFVAMA